MRVVYDFYFVKENFHPTLDLCVKQCNQLQPVADLCWGKQWPNHFGENPREGGRGELHDTRLCDQVVLLEEVAARDVPMLLALASPPPPAPELKNLFRMELKVLHY
jgi:hypothetical protein